MLKAEGKIQPSTFLWLALFLALALAWLWPVPSRLTSRIPSDQGDPVFNTWVLWWNAQAVPFTDRWWSPPVFYPLRGTLAFSEHLFGIAVFTTPLQFAGLNAVGAYNVATDPLVVAVRFLRVSPGTPADRIVARWRDRRSGLRPGAVQGRTALASAGADGAVDAARASCDAPVSGRAALQMAGALRGRLAPAGLFEWLLPALLSRPDWRLAARGSCTGRPILFRDLRWSGHSRCRRCCSSHRS